MCSYDLTQISLGRAHSCARLTTGAARCWGANESGQLGDGTVTARRSPVAVSGLVSGVAQVAAGGAHTCARLATGAARCWGANGAGQVGDGTTVNRRVPTAVSGLGAGVAQVMAGGAHTCARLTVGTLRCWGTNGSGQLGDGTLVARKVPVAVTGVTGAAGLALGSSHTLVRVDGTGGLRSWGRGSSGQLGTGVTATRAVAGTVVGLG